MIIRPAFPKEENHAVQPLFCLRRYVAGECSFLSVVRDCSVPNVWGYCTITTSHQLWRKPVPEQPLRSASASAVFSASPMEISWCNGSSIGSFDFNYC